jgi:hypothetical protein
VIVAAEVARERAAMLLQAMRTAHRVGSEDAAVALAVRWACVAYGEGGESPQLLPRVPGPRRSLACATCGAPTSEGKPYCIAHLDSLPYARAVREGLTSRETMRRARHAMRRTG